MLQRPCVKLISFICKSIALEVGSGDSRLSAPMPGKVVSINVNEGTVVKAGSPLLVLEAMKMEHTISAPADGFVERLPFAVGDMVTEGDEVVVFSIEQAEL